MERMDPTSPIPPNSSKPQISINPVGLGAPEVGSGWTVMRKTAAPLGHKRPLPFPEEDVESPLWPRGALPTLADPIPGGWGWGEKCFPQSPLSWGYETFFLL